ncbi:hypothetical protein [Fructobacillus fructosus]|uniref:hypothetical protein n=1 Tax=Fructobacillus fructosus TaxID=1631 RepID=UPI0030C845BE
MVNGLRYFNVSSSDEVANMTPREYQLQIEAAQLKEIDKKHAIHEIAWASMAVEQTNASGNSLKFDTFDKFFERDYKKAINKIKQEFNPKAAVDIPSEESGYNMDLLQELERGVNG